MAQKQIEPVSAVSVEIQAGNRFKMSQTNGEFRRLGEFVEELLDEIGVKTGRFTLIPLKLLPGSQANYRSRLRITRIDGDNGLMIVTQLDASAAAWEYRLLLPKDLNSSQFRLRMETGLERRQERPARRAVDPPPELEAPPEMLEQVCVHDFVEDLERVALVIGNLFPIRHSGAALEILIQVLIDEHAWTYENAWQATLALINRKHLRMVGQGDARCISVLEGKLSEHLVLLGLLKEELTDTAKKAAPCVTPSQKEVLRAEIQNATAGKAVQKLDEVVEPSHTKPFARLLAPPVQKSAQKKAKPGTSSPKGVASSLGDLERKAKAFQEAQQKLRQSEPARTALEQRKQRILQELASVERSQKTLDQESSSAMRIVSDPEYSQAANKIQKITAIMEE